MSQVYTVTIDDASSIINWHPQGDGGIGDWTANGWQPYYSGTPTGFTTQGGESASGESMHITAYPNAAFDFQFFGTSVSLVGIANCSYEVTVDGNTAQSFEARPGLSTTLFSQDGLSEALHNISLTANASHGNQFAFQHADVSRTVVTGAQVPTSHVYQAINMSFVSYNGSWTVTRHPETPIPNPQHPAPYMEVQDAPASFSFSFQGTGVAINGTRDWGSYTYNVTLDGQEPATYNASTLWFIGHALLYYKDGLDPNATHTVNVEPKVGDGLKFWLNTITVFTDDSSEAGGLVRHVQQPDFSAPGSTITPSDIPSGTGKRVSQTHVGPIVGGVIGALAFLALLAGFLWYILRKGQATRIRVYERDQPSPFTAPSTTLKSRAQKPIWSTHGARGGANLKHVVLHAADNEAWGTYGCNWHNCSHKFSDAAKLAHHLRKHAMTPLFCPYEGCDKSFNTPEAFLAHHKSSKHRDGTLRRSTQPFPVLVLELELDIERSRCRARGHGMPNWSMHRGRARTLQTSTEIDRLSVLLLDPPVGMLLTDCDGRRMSG
ncbi:hypothetical protein NUW54_g11248 [Trametes sanguinea]|uniref:Uncharacterized protein n=1 Tax=Trametes sanguinea TaxID=158606 RepID=A0ACC1NIF5_9APHY|nr:hypothetical protein NUW54_g11248 [Trametes sanguinea]